MQHTADIIVISQAPGAWIGRLACVSRGVNKILRPLYSTHWQSAAACDRIIRLIGIRRTVQIEPGEITFKEVRLSEKTRKIIYREVNTQSSFQEVKRVVINPQNKSIMTLVMVWEEWNDEWPNQGAAVKLKHYKHEKEIPELLMGDSEEES